MAYALALYLISTVVFLLTYSAPISPLVAAIRPASGFISVILLPGAFVTHCVISERWRNLGTNLLLGLMLAIIETHLLFIVSLITNLQIPFVLWICSMNTLIAITCLIYILRGSTKDLFQAVLQFGSDRRLLLVAVLGLVLRFVLLGIAQESIAPDASLYANYARGIIDGNFQSSVLNDGAVSAIGDNVAYLAHQAFAYVFAISWLLLPPTTSGPTLLLPLIGVALVFPTYSITNRFFGPSAAICAAFIVAMHPLFVFHSSVAYGPEITSLLFILSVILFFVDDRTSSPKAFLVAGLLIGLVDVLWYANFYLVCIALPAILVLLRILDRSQFIVFSTTMLFVILATTFIRNIVVFFVSWAILFAVLALARELRPNPNLQRLVPFVVGIASVAFLWSWPLRMAAAYSTSAITQEGLFVLLYTLFTSAIAFFSFWIALFVAIELAPRNGTNIVLRKAAIILVGVAAVVFLWIWLLRIAALISDYSSPQMGSSVLASAAVSPLSVSFFLSFLLFLVFHITPALLCLVPAALIRGKNKPTAVAFFATGLLTALGTLKVLSGVSGSLGLQYLYSDSRFFLFVTLMCIISLGAYFGKLAIGDDSGHNSTDVKLHITRRQRRSILIFSLIMVGFVPSYLAMPSGLALINIEEQYAWSGLPNAVSQIGDNNTVFLVDRAREFAWFTGRKSAVLELSNMSLPYANTSRELLSLAANFSTDYLVVDCYTLAHWRTLDFLLLEPISIGTSVILGDLEIVELYESSNNISAPALTLIAQTEPNEFGSYCRVFGFDTASFARLREVSILDSGWSTSNGGSITNVSGEVRLTIGNDQNSTNTWRPGGFDFNQMVNSGFLLLDLEGISATVARIEVWDENGIILRHAENLGDGLYYCPLGEVTIGDIRIVIEGSSGESIIVRSISVWQVENP